MNILKKTLNKFNGNLCFAANTESGYTVFECNSSSQSISYDISSKPILDVCNMELNRYLVCFGNNQLGLFDGSSLNESFSTSPVTANLIMSGQILNNFYIWSKLGNCIVSANVMAGTTTVIWTLPLPSDFSSCTDAEIFYKPTSDLIIFKGQGKMLSIRDMSSYANVFGNIVTESNNWVTSSGDNYPFISYARTRQVFEEDLESSSSSSSISGTSSSSSSSSSFSFSSSSSSSSGDFLLNYCVSGGYADTNGTYFYNKKAAYFHGAPIYINSNAITYMFIHVYDGVAEWNIDYEVVDGRPGLIYKLSHTRTPDGTDWHERIGGGSVQVAQNFC